MTVVVAFLCSDGAVVASDSMLTTGIGTAAGQVNIGHHTGIKCSVIGGGQILAWAGDSGLAARFRLQAETLHPRLGAAVHPLHHGLLLSQNTLADFVNTRIDLNRVDLATVLAFEHNGNCHCCLFLGPVQPRLLDPAHFYAALGSGILSADPFLRFVSDTFCEGRQPTVHLATFLAVWVVQHVIDVNPGGVAGPIRVAVFEKEANGQGYAARELPALEIETHINAIDGAAEALRAWRNNIQSGAAAGGVDAPPIAPAADIITVSGVAPEVAQGTPAPAAVSVPPSDGTGPNAAERAPA